MPPNAKAQWVAKMADIARRGGKKNRKHGGTKKQPAQQRYVAEKRSEKNRARKVAKTNAWHALCAKVRAKFGKVKDVGRKVRQLRRGEG